MLKLYVKLICLCTVNVENFYVLYILVNMEIFVLRKYLQILQNLSPKKTPKKTDRFGKKQILWCTMNNITWEFFHIFAEITSANTVNSKITKWNVKFDNDIMSLFFYSTNAQILFHFQRSEMIFMGS